MSKFKHSGTISIKGFDFQWQIKHWGGASSAYQSYRGISVSVCIEYGEFKELIIEFPFTDYFFDSPKSQKEFESRLQNSIEDAIDQGWRPESRGKAFHYSVEM